MLSRLPEVKVNQLSKSYSIGHQSLRFGTLRECFSRKTKFPGHRPPHQPPHQPAREIHWALREVSFSLGAGEVVGIVGTNGAGKSTLLRILARITEPTEGHAWLRGRVASVLGIGAGFHPELTGEENLYLNGAILGLSRNEIKKRKTKIIEFAGIEKFAATPMKHFSSGMGARLAFSIAAHLDPDILLIDETLVVGDEGFQKRALNRMTEIAGRGRIVLMVTHDLSSINALCTSVLLLNKGRLVSSGETKTVLRDYLESTV